MSLSVRPIAGRRRRGNTALTLAAAFEADPSWSWIFGGGPCPTGRCGQVLGAVRTGCGGQRRRPGRGRRRWPWRCGCRPVLRSCSPRTRPARRRSPRRSWASGAGRWPPCSRRSRSTGRSQEHQYLDLLVTRPTDRGRGVGMALLAVDLAELDAIGRPAYLESSNPANLAALRVRRVPPGWTRSRCRTAARHRHDVARPALTTPTPGPRRAVRGARPRPVSGRRRCRRGAGRPGRRRRGSPGAGRAAPGPATARRAGRRHRPGRLAQDRQQPPADLPVGAGAAVRVGSVRRTPGAPAAARRTSPRPGTAARAAPSPCTPGRRAPSPPPPTRGRPGSVGQQRAASALGAGHRGRRPRSRPATAPGEDPAHVGVEHDVPPAVREGQRPRPPCSRRRRAARAARRTSAAPRPPCRSTITRPPPVQPQRAAWVAEPAPRRGSPPRPGRRGQRRPGRPARQPRVDAGRPARRGSAGQHELADQHGPGGTVRRAARAGRARRSRTRPAPARRRPGRSSGSVSARVRSGSSAQTFSGGTARADAAGRGGAGSVAPVSSMMRPVGPQPPSVYWVRRALALVVVIGVVLAAVWLVSGRGGDGTPSAAAGPATSPSTAPVASPSPSPSHSSTKKATSTPTPSRSVTATSRRTRRPRRRSRGCARTRRSP